MFKENEDSMPNKELKRPLILIVEDDKIQQKIIRDLIEKCGYHTITANDGLQGLKLAKECLPDVVFSDALMPHMDGRALCYHLKNDPVTSHIKV
ncbi:MAG: response regulator, partial [Acidobacteriota bacterium]